MTHDEMIHTLHQLAMQLKAGTTEERQVALLLLTATVSLQNGMLGQLAALCAAWIEPHLSPKDFEDIYANTHQPD